MTECIVKDGLLWMVKKKYKNYWEWLCDEAGTEAVLGDGRFSRWEHLISKKIEAKIAGQG